MDGGLSHPYYPTDARITNYAPNERSVLGLLSIAGLGSTALLGVTLLLSTWARPKLRKGDRIAILWFVLCTNLRTLFKRPTPLTAMETSGHSSLLF